MCSRTDLGATTLPPPASSRRGFLFTLGLALNGIAAALVGIPVVGYLVGPFGDARSRPGSAWVRSRASPRGRRAWPSTRTRSAWPGTGRRRTSRAGCAGSTASSSRSSRSTARISAARCDGSPSRGSSCVRATAASTTRTARAPRARRRGDCSSTSTRSATGSSGCAAVSSRRCLSRRDAHCVAPIDRPLVRGAHGPRRHRRGPHGAIGCRGAPPAGRTCSAARR